MFRIEQPVAIFSSSLSVESRKNNMPEPADISDDEEVEG
jgi:hypothetical protein